MDREYVTKLIEDALAKFLPGETVRVEGGAYPSICDQNEEFWLEDGPEPVKTLGKVIMRDKWSLLQNCGDGQVECVGVYDTDLQAAAAFVRRVVKSRVNAHFERVCEGELADFHKE
jgi:hypothetical protein